MRSGPPTIEDIAKRLNKLYIENPDGYQEHLTMVKGLGYRVFRNSTGKHKLEINPNHLNEAFGGIFGDIFGG